MGSVSLLDTLFVLEGDGRKELLHHRRCAAGTAPDVTLKEEMKQVGPPADRDCSDFHCVNWLCGGDRHFGMDGKQYGDGWPKANDMPRTAKEQDDDAS